MTTINPRRFLASLSLGLSMLALGGCSPQESSDKTPPDYTIAKADTAHGKYLFGVTDTLSIGFSEKIDTGALVVEFSPAQGIEKRWSTRTRMLVHGKNKSAGTTHFTINSPFTATLSGLRDLEGNGRSPIVLSFQPHWWSDRDFTDSLFDGFDSLYATDSTWGDGSPFSQPLATEGRLDRQANLSRDEDRQDFKVIKLVPPDSLYITATSPKNMNLRIQIAGPFRPEKVDSVLANYVPATESFFADSTRNRGTVSHTFSADYGDHDDVLGSPSAPGVYAVRLSIPEDQEGFYRLDLRLHRKKRN